MKKRIRLGILFGGRSGEHEVSLTSAASLLQRIDPNKYEVIPIGITREGRWMVGRSPERLGAGTGGLLPEVLAKGTPVAATADPTGPTLLPLNSVSSPARSRAAAAGARRQVDVIFPVLHGSFGEDGTVQGLLELAGIPYVGAGVLGSAAGMDKDVMKRLFRDAGLPIVDWITTLRRDWQRHPMAARHLIEKRLGYPLFVKPANLGSSVGISHVRRRNELGSAIALAAEYDAKVLVERAVPNAREIECSVLGNDHPEASVPGEVVPINDFYDYEAKYIKEGSELIVPARLTRRQTAQVRDYAVRAFRAIDGAGMARVDFLLDSRRGKVWVNEINTIPGFTPISMYPRLWEASGVPYPQLVDRLIELALERHREKARTRYTYRRGRK